MKALDSLWPSLASLHDTIGTDAHTLDPAVLLAVHQPMRFRRVEYGKAIGEALIVEEQEVLDALLADDGEGRVIIPIAGRSGTGKSHIIRWLEAELQSRTDTERRHVILVPKSSSLKSVLRLILRDLEGSRYNKIRKSLERASESLPEVVAMDLRTRLISELKSKTKSASNRLRTGSSPDKRADERDSSWGLKVAALLDDPELWKHHFYGEENSPTGVLARLADNVTHEGSVHRRYQFKPEDFDGLANAVKVSDLSLDARRPIVLLADKKYREICADLLNDVLDQATQNLLDLGSTPLSEVLLELRRALLEDGKELVILVEDFAVLSGMQGALLDALIHEGRVGGKQEYCAIRSALAYTSGYQNKPMDRDTVRTRARAVWEIEDTPGTEEEILDRTVELVGAYWNAARWGLEALKVQHKKASGKNWIMSYEPEGVDEDEGRTIEEFGRTRGRYPLFPLNVAAIRQLTKEKCVFNGELVFNPRSIIDRIVLDVVKLRNFYEKGMFPPRSIGNSTLTSSDVLEVINRVSVDQRDRVYALVTYWAELPDSVAGAARLPSSVYEAFRLQSVDFGATPPDTPKVPDKKKSGAGGSSSAPAPITDQFDAAWKPTLNKWLSGERLDQAPARSLRKWISDAVFSSLPTDWPGVRACIDKDVLANRHTYLPNARGAAGCGETEAAISLCSDGVWSDPLLAVPIQQALEAVIRFHGIDDTRSSWNYPRAEAHAVRYANFVAVRRRRLLDWFEKKRGSQQEQRDFSLSNLVENRLMSAAVLGVGVKGGNQIESAIDVLFVDLPEPQQDFPEAWRILLNEAGQQAKKSRNDLIELVAARQGTGDKLLAIDVASLRGPVRDFLRKWEMSDDPNIQKSFASTMRRGIKARRSELEQWRSKTTEWLGQKFDKHAIVNEIRELLTEAKQLAVCSQDNVSEVRQLIDRFRDSAVTEALDEAELALREQPDGTSIPALAFDYTRIIQVTETLRERLHQLFDEIDSGINSKNKNSGTHKVQQMIALVNAKLEATEETLIKYMEIRSYDGS